MRPIVSTAARWLAVLGTALPLLGAEPFQIEARKKALPWIWEVPRPQAVPASANAHAQNDVDRFIQARLQKEGLQQAPPVDDASWLRRAHFVVTGLPPTPADLDTFLATPAEHRRSRAADRLLASPHFGERWARHWMDLVRYGESRGHEFDYAIANAWQYRDYLIRAFNADLPYDQFVTEHVAGDLIAPRLHPQTGTHESILATGWAFLGEEAHSPVDIRGDECERLDNKVDVFAKTFLGLTVACARCHDHKFDAISQRDYYSLSGFFSLSSYRQARFETMTAHDEVASRLAAIRARHAPGIAHRLAETLRPGLAGVEAALLQALREGPIPAEAPSRTNSASWRGELVRAATTPLHPLHAIAQAAKAPRKGSATATGPKPDSLRVIADFTRPGVTPWKADGPTFGTAPVPAGELLLGVDPAGPVVQVAAHGSARRDGFWNPLALARGNEPDAGSLGAHHRSGRMIRTPRVTLESGRIHYLLRGRARVYAGVDAHIMIAGPLHGRLVAGFDGGASPAWVTHDLEPYSGHRAHFEFGPDGDGPLEVLMVVESPARPTWMPGAPMLSSATPETASVEDLVHAFATRLTEAVDVLGRNGLRARPELAPFAAWAVEHARLLAGTSPDGLARDFIRERDGLASTVRWDSRTAPALMDGSGDEERLLVRGKPNRPAEESPRSLPVAFGFKSTTPTNTSGRLELARQLTDPANPLVARVLVNRVWQHTFGRGLVPTPDNFGVLGERPTHPELLDHLAWQFVHQEGWSIKRLLRRLLLTDLFAAGPVPHSPDVTERDPSNLLWTRIPVRRLEGESIRDAILVVSGRFDPAVGGRPVPIHLTSFHDARGRPELSGPLDGQGRRSVYGAVRRNFMPSMMVAFDFPTPFNCIGRRNRTNVPAQSLVLMNDPFVHEQAAVWASRLLQAMPDAADADRVRHLFSTALARPPATAEIEACCESLAVLRQIHGTGLQAEKAAWADLCHALLNMNEFVHVK